MLSSAWTEKKINIMKEMYAGAHRTPKIGCFPPKFFCLVTQRVQKQGHWSLYEVIEDILPFVLNTKRSLSDIWPLSYKRNSFGCFLKKLKFWIFSKTPKNVFLISQQPNIKTAGYPLSPHIKYKDHCCNFFYELSNKATKKRCILKSLKKHPTLGVQCTP